MSNKKILILPGDGIGNEVMAEVLKIIDWMEKTKSLSFDISERLVGGVAYDKEGNSISDETMQVAQDSDAVLFGAVGGSKWDSVEREKRPEAALLRLRKELDLLTGNRRTRLNVREVRQPELDAFLVARNIADQLERRIAFRRAIRQALTRTMQAGAEGIKIIASGRLAGADIARSEKAHEGRVPLHTLRADIDYGLAEAGTEYGVIGVKVWICKGQIMNPTLIGESLDRSDVTTATSDDDEEVPAIQVLVTANEEESRQKLEEVDSNEEAVSGPESEITNDPSGDLSDGSEES